MRKAHGFTLVELLVVIAIIGILAAIVVPNVANWISRARMARAVSEIRGAELAMTKMLTDVDKKDFRQFFSPAGLADYYTWDMATQIYVCTDISYRMLRLGRDMLTDPTYVTNGAALEWVHPPSGLTISLNRDVVGRLGINYIDQLGTDPWNTLYQFWFGPWRDGQVGGVDINTMPIVFRSRRPPLEDGSPYAYDADARLAAEAEVPGAPGPDDQPGFPAPRKLSVYIYSLGEDMQPNQLYVPDKLDYEGGGDDINNWDSKAGWAPYYS